MARACLSPKEMTRKQQLIAARLLNSGLHYLGELDVPFVLVFRGTDQIFSNVDSRLAVALLEDKAHFSMMLREKGMEAKVEKLLDIGGDSDATA